MKLRNANLHFVDMRYSDKGHYLDDLREFEFVGDSFSCIYYAPCGVEIILPVDFKSETRKKGWGFYLLIYKLLLFKRRERIFFLSCSYIPLFILSILSLNFNYAFRVHSMPIVKVKVYKYIIRLLSKFSCNTVFLDYPVKEFFVNSGFSDKEKSICVIGRTIEIESTNAPLIVDEQSKFKLLFIGAINEEKDLTPVINGLCQRKIDGVSLSFLSKGISKYSKNLAEMQKIYPDTCVIDGFLLREEFDKEISKADALILPYKKSYGVRFSAVLNDALKQGKKVLTIQLPQFEYYAKLYNACYLYNDESDIEKAVVALINSKPLRINKLCDEYSEDVKVKQFLRINF
jgi:glycosyltransferase involved in cell wall biosynthesis